MRNREEIAKTYVNIALSTELLLDIRELLMDLLEKQNER